MEFPRFPCKNIGTSVEKTELTWRQNRVKMKNIMDISKVTEYLYVGPRVGKVLVGVETAFPIIQIKAFEKYLQTT